MFKNLSKDHLIIKIKEGCHSQIHTTKKKKNYESHKQMGFTIIDYF